MSRIVVFFDNVINLSAKLVQSVGFMLFSSNIKFHKKKINDVKKMRNMSQMSGNKITV